MFDQCLADKNIEQSVKRDISAGRKAGVTGTPAFYLGPSLPMVRR